MNFVKIYKEAGCVISNIKAKMDKSAKDKIEKNRQLALAQFDKTAALTQKQVSHHPIPDKVIECWRMILERTDFKGVHSTQCAYLAHNFFVQMVDTWLHSVPGATWNREQMEKSKGKLLTL